MEKFDWKATIRKNITFLRLTGLWPARDETYKFNAYSIYCALSMTIFIFGHNFFQTFNIIFIFDDLEAVIATAFVSLSEIIAMFKALYLIQNMKMLKQLMVTLNSDVFQPKNLRQRNLVEPTLKLWQIVYTGFSISAFCGVFFCVTYPILDNSVEEYRLPSLAWYPYNTQVSPLYEMTYLYQAASVFITAFVSTNVDTLVAALNMFAGAQCDILCDNLRHIQEFSDIARELVNCVRHHQTIVKFAENSNIFFNRIIFVQFFTSVVSIAMTLFQLTTVVAFSSEFYFYIFFCNAVIVETFLYCWYGNQVLVKSENIAYAAFESGWTTASVELQKELLFFILRCQKPIKISALNLFDLTLDTFMKIMRAAWSAFAVLNQVSDSN